MDINRDEFLGKRIEVKNCSDKSKIGINGIVLNETKNTISIRTKIGIKRIPKKETKFEICSDKCYEVDGKNIVKRPEDRINMKKKW